MTGLLPLPIASGLLADPASIGSALTGRALTGPAFTGPALRVIEAPAFATVQDAGRSGWLRWGVSGGGAMDPEALATANALVGGRWDDAAVEFALTGGEWEVAAQSCRLAVCGGGFGLLVDGEPREAGLSMVLRHGQRLAIAGAPDAVWGYLAVQGGIDVPEALGSRSTHVRSRLGGLGGRAIAVGDLLPLRLDEIRHAPTLKLKLPARDAAAEIRVVPGPQDDHFEEPSLRAFTAAEWRVSTRIDRMGYHMTGPVLVHSSRGANIVSDGTVAGSIQVPASGQPIALMMDRQPTGGYPKIATVATADLGRLAQRRPGAAVRFRAVHVDEAVRLRREFVAGLRGIARVAAPTRVSFARRHGDLQVLIAALGGTGPGSTGLASPSLDKGEARPWRDKPRALGPAAFPALAHPGLAHPAPANLDLAAR